MAVDYVLLEDGVSHLTKEDGTGNFVQETSVPLQAVVIGGFLVVLKNIVGGVSVVSGQVVGGLKVVPKVAIGGFKVVI